MTMQLAGMNQRDLKKLYDALPPESKDNVASTPGRDSTPKKQNMIDSVLKARMEHMKINLEEKEKECELRLRNALGASLEAGGGAGDVATDKASTSMAASIYVPANLSSATFLMHAVPAILSKQLTLKLMRRQFMYPDHGLDTLCARAPKLVDIVNPDGSTDTKLMGDRSGKLYSNFMNLGLKLTMVCEVVVGRGSGYLAGHTTPCPATLCAAVGHDVGNDIIESFQGLQDAPAFVEKSSFVTAWSVKAVQNPTQATLKFVDCPVFIEIGNSQRVECVIKSLELDMAAFLTDEGEDLRSEGKFFELTRPMLDSELQAAAAKQERKKRKPADHTEHDDEVAELAELAYGEDPPHQSAPHVTE